MFDLYTILYFYVPEVSYKFLELKTGSQGERLRSPRLVHGKPETDAAYFLKRACEVP